jgi:hypothetical protein
MIDTLIIALAIALVLSLLVVAIELSYEAKVSRPRAYLGGSFLVYLFIMAVGNSAATLLGSTIVSERLPPELARWSAFFFAFFGVFAFEVIISRTNVTFFDKGVLTISSWISKARDTAVARAVSRNAQIERDGVESAAARLKKLPDAQLNTYLDTYLGAGTAAKLTLAATASGSDPQLYKALELANKKPGETASIIKARGL